MSNFITASTILLIGSVIFHTGRSAPDFRFYAKNDDVDVKYDALVSFQLENSHENNHDVTGFVTYYNMQGYNFYDEDLNTEDWGHNQPLTIQRLDAKGYFCSRWAEDNTTVEYVCRVVRNNATANVSKLVFHMTYKLLEGTTRMYNATSTATFDKVGIGSTRHSTTDRPGTSMMDRINDALHRTKTHNSAISTVCSQAPTMYVLAALSIISMIH